MKKSDLVFVLCAVAVLLPFFVSDTVYEAYRNFNSSHGLVMSFIKFAVLSTAGEMLGARISRGSYVPKGFGIFPKMVVWGFLGVGISAAMTIFSSGTPVFLESAGIEGARAAFEGPLTWMKVFVAFSISVAQNTIFAPVFMTLHKITDAHIAGMNGSARALVTPVKMGKIMSELNWKVQWNFVFKKTIPLFWFPAHTITFLLPADMRVLFAAVLGVVLGVLLAIAVSKGK